jgi:hypothetical protein
MGSLTKDFSSNGFVMMMNNYNCVKEFDVTHLNIRELTWYVINGIGNPFPGIDYQHMDLVVELELLLIEPER